MPIYHKWDGTVLTITSDSGTSSCDLKGDTGIRGPQGIQGLKGEKGAGEKGDKGEPFTYADFTEEQLASFVGPEGPTGPAGERGKPFTYEDFTEAQLEALKVKGDTGATGPIGPKGDKGEAGIGLPVGGTSGQVLIKASAADYDFTWGNVGGAYNYLDNSFFANPINQRGQTDYTNSYSIDRWKTTGTLTVNSGYITTAGNTYQYLENMNSSKTYTFAYCSNNGVITIGNSPTFEDGIATITLPAGNYIWAALYEGAYTADNLPPYFYKGYAAELAECQRYYIRYANVGTYTLPFAYGATATNASVARYKIDLPCSMRTTPTLNCNNINWQILSNGTTYEVSEIIIFKMVGNSIHLTVTSEGLPLRRASSLNYYGSTGINAAVEFSADL